MIFAFDASSNGRGHIELSEYNRFSKGIFAWVGFRTKYIEYTQKNGWQEILRGVSALFKYSLEGIINFQMLHSIYFFFMGGFVCLVSFILMFLIVVSEAAHENELHSLCLVTV